MWWVSCQHPNVLHSLCRTTPGLHTRKEVATLEATEDNWWSDAEKHTQTQRKCLWKTQRGGRKARARKRVLRNLRKYKRRSGTLPLERVGLRFTLNTAMRFRFRRYRVVLPFAITGLHLLLTAIAEVQYRTGWAYIPPTVSFDPSPIPIAEHLAIWLSFPAYVVTLALSILLRSPTEGTTLLLMETPFVILFWHLVGRLIEARQNRAVIQHLKF